MATRVQGIFQSGEKVAVQGCYEVAGAPQIQRALSADEIFPNYDGRAVCWRLAEDDQPFVSPAIAMRRNCSRRIPFAQR